MRPICIFLLPVALLATPAWAGDKDKDGVSNKLDQCKKTPEDIDGFEDDDGCPDPDNDQDGLLDADDKCPEKKEDKDDFQDEDGCPDPDNDEDGVMDDDDQCPLETEDDKGDKDGCPEVSFGLIKDDGWLPALTSLTTDLSAASKQKEKGCVDASTTINQWNDDHNASDLAGVFNARLERSKTLEPDQMNNLVSLKMTVYKGMRDALNIYCKDDAGWTSGVKETDAQLAPWLK